MSDFRVGRGLPILSREPVDDLEGSSQHFLLSWVFSPIWNHEYVFSTLGHPDSVQPVLLAAAAAAKSLQSCPTLCDPIDGSPPGFSVHGIFPARVLTGVGCHCLLHHTSWMLLKFL